MRARSYRHALADSALRTALFDPDTGLPNAAYFQLIWDWELRRAERGEPRLRIARLAVSGGDESCRRALAQQLPLVFRRSDFIAMHDARTFELLFSALDHDKLEVVRERVEDMVRHLNEKLAPAEPLVVGIDAIDAGTDDRSVAEPPPPPKPRRASRARRTR
ncbi:MAG: hypothetical protein IRY91_09635 [Gemmatimonadaceae bacterium]|nr:hypothetical protein [Gemmatimonadaceae bacterium]